MMVKIHRVIVFTFCLFFLLAISHAEGLSRHNDTSSAKLNLYQVRFEFTKKPDERVSSNIDVHKKGKTALLIGSIGLAASYVATAAIGSGIASSWGHQGPPYYLIPVVGPFLQIQETGSPYTELCILSGAVQTGFLAVLVYGIIKNKKSSKEPSFQMVWAPIVSKKANGFMFEFRF